MLRLGGIAGCAIAQQPQEGPQVKGGRLGTEVEEFPEPCGCWNVDILGGRVEHIVEPFLCFGEPLVLRQVHRDRDRDVVEQLPVVVGVRQLVVEVDLLAARIHDNIC